MEELFFVEAKLPRTLRRLVWRPGDLTVEWNRGRRAAYVQPFRLYLGTALLFFLLWPHTALHDATYEFVSGFVREGPDGTDATSPLQIELGTEAIGSNLPSLVLILFMPVFAALLMAANRFRAKFVQHLVASLHFHSVGFLASVLSVPLAAILPGRDWAATTTLLALFLFLVFMIARVYETSCFRAAVRAAAVAAAYLVIVLVSLTVLLGRSSL